MAGLTLIADSGPVRRGQCSDSPGEGGGLGAPVRRQDPQRLGLGQRGRGRCARWRSDRKGPAQPGAAPAVGSNPRACASTGQAAVAAGVSHWEVVDGALSPCGDTAGYLISKQNYKDLVLAVDFRTGEDTNSGVFVRISGGLGYEVQIWKAQPAGYNTGSIVGAGKTDREYKFLADQWNHYEITADGDHLVVVLNGTKTLDIHDSQFQRRDPVAIPEIPDRVQEHQDARDQALIESIR